MLGSSSSYEKIAKNNYREIDYKGFDNMINSLFSVNRILCLNLD